MKGNILIIDDEEGLRVSLSQVLSIEGYTVSTASSGKEALRILSEAGSNSFLPDLIFLDVRLPDSDGVDLLQKFKELYLNLPVILITAYGSVRQSVEAMKKGAFDYILKPVHSEEILIRAKKALEISGLKNHVNHLSSQLLDNEEVQFVFGVNNGMKELLKKVELVSKSSTTPVLICGETGTGKELIAKKIHYKSKRGYSPFIAINASALSSELLESELFGHEAGAFTGATKTKKGLFEAASGGSLFLDEIGDMEYSLQTKLLRAIEEQKIRRVGSIEEISIDVRFLAATNKQLEVEVENGRFRKDLYYRLNVVQLDLPPLRERKEDIEILVIHFIRIFNKEFLKNVNKITPKALDALKEHLWPGNIRELRNVIERALLLSCQTDLLNLEDLTITNVYGNSSLLVNQKMLGENISLELVEREHIQGVLSSNNGNKNLAAQILGIDRTTLYNKLKKYQVEKSYS